MNDSSHFDLLFQVHIWKSYLNNYIKFFVDWSYDFCSKDCGLLESFIHWITYIDLVQNISEHLFSQQRGQQHSYRPKRIWQESERATLVFLFISSLKEAFNICAASGRYAAQIKKFKTGIFNPNMRSFRQIVSQKFYSAFDFKNCPKVVLSRNLKWERVSLTM